MARHLSTACNVSAKSARVSILPITGTKGLYGASLPLTIFRFGRKSARKPAPTGIWPQRLR